VNKGHGAQFLDLATCSGNKMPLRLAVFDFDQTLSACHLYHALAGGNGGIEVFPPYARTERGQLARLAELDASPDYESAGGFTVAAFGGQTRLGELKAALEELHDGGVECVVCSRGLVGPIRRSLDQVGLLQLFSHVFANTGSSPGTEYDQNLPVDALGVDVRFLQAEGTPRWGPSKGRLVERCMNERGLQWGEAVFVDDTASEIQSVQRMCYTIQVQPPAGEDTPQGMGRIEFDLLRGLLSEVPSPSHSASPRASQAESAGDLSPSFLGSPVPGPRFIRQPSCETSPQHAQTLTRTSPLGPNGKLKPPSISLCPPRSRFTALPLGCGPPKCASATGKPEREATRSEGVPSPARSTSPAVDDDLRQQATSPTTGGKGLRLPVRRVTAQLALPKGSGSRQSSPRVDNSRFRVRSVGSSPVLTAGRAVPSPHQQVRRQPLAWDPKQLYSKVDSVSLPAPTPTDVAIRPCSRGLGIRKLPPEGTRRCGVNSPLGFLGSRQRSSPDLVH